MKRSFALLAALTLTLVACASQPPPEAAPAKPVSLFGYTTTSVDAAHPVNVPIDIMLVTEGNAPAPAFDQEKADAQTFVAHLNVVYEKTGIRFVLRRIGLFNVPQEVADSHVPWRSVLPPPVDASAYTLYLLPSMTTKAGAPLNGLPLSQRAAAVGLNARLASAGTSGVSEPTVRVAAHVLGGMLGLTASKDPKNLMASGTTGTELDASQIKALQVPTDLVAPVVTFSTAPTSPTAPTSATAPTVAPASDGQTAH